MSATAFFFDLMIILVAGRVFGELAVRVGMPPVIGELTAGLLLGPSLLGVIEVNEPIRLTAELGVIMLLFKVGLETDFDRLAHAGFRAVRVAVVGFVAPFALGYLLASQLFGQSTLTSLFIGGTLTATSIGVTVRILGDLGRLDGDEGQTVLGAAVIDDIMGVMLLAVLFEFSRSGAVEAATLIRVILFIGMFFLLAPLVATAMTRFVHKASLHSEIPGMLTTFIVSLVLGFGALAHLLGAPELLGGFAAGLALSRRFYLPFGLALSANPKLSEQIDREMLPIVNLFSPVFFVVVGISLDLQNVDWGSLFFWAFSLSLLAVAIIGKLAGALTLRDMTWPSRLAVGTSMVPRGEVGLVFAESGRASGIFSMEIYTVMVIVVAYTTLLAPFGIKLFFNLFGHHLPSSVSATGAVRVAGD